MTKDEVMKLSDKELRIKAEELQGVKVVYDEWPCGVPQEVCKLEAAYYVIKQGDKWVTDDDWYGQLCPVVLEDFPGARWPPEKCLEKPMTKGKWSANVRPVPDYPNDITAAWGLAEKANLSIVRVGNKWWVAEFDGKRFKEDPMIDELAARAITRAFILARGGE